MSTLQTFKIIYTCVLFSLCIFKALANSPTQVFIAIDNSNSMSQDHLWIANAAITLKNELLIHPGQVDDFKLYTYPGARAIKLSGNAGDIAQQLNSLTSSTTSNTALSPMKKLIEQQVTQDAQLILFTDGHQTSIKQHHHSQLLNAIRAKNVTVHAVIDYPLITLAQQVAGMRGLNIGINNQQQFAKLRNSLSCKQINASFNRLFDDWFERMPQSKQEQFNTEKKYLQLKSQWIKQNSIGLNPQVNLALKSSGVAWHLPSIAQNPKIFSEYIKMAILKGNAFAKEYHRPYGANVVVTGDIITDRKTVGNLITFEANSDTVDSWEWDFDGDGHIDLNELK